MIDLFIGFAGIGLNKFFFILENLMNKPKLQYLIFIII